MRWTLTIKNQTYGAGIEVGKYEFRITRTGDTVRASFENLSPGNLREGRLWMPSEAARMVGSALLLAASHDAHSINVVFSVDEGKARRQS